MDLQDRIIEIESTGYQKKKTAKVKSYAEKYNNMPGSIYTNQAYDGGAIAKEIQMQKKLYLDCGADWPFR